MTEKIAEEAKDRDLGHWKVEEDLDHWKEETNGLMDMDIARIKGQLSRKSLTRRRKKRKSFIKARQS
jgi:hypothetical protein